jgi:hypothetical protein
MRHFRLLQGAFQNGCNGYRFRPEYFGVDIQSLSSLRNLEEVPLQQRSQRLTSAVEARLDD